MTLNPKCEDVETVEGVAITVTGEDHCLFIAFRSPFSMRSYYDLCLVGVAQVKVMQDGELLTAACEQFLGREVSDIKQTILHTLEGHLRAILGTLSVEDIYRVSATKWELLLVI